MIDREAEEFEPETRARFEALRAVAVEPSPYLKTRALAGFEEAREARARKRGLASWWSMSPALRLAPLAVLAVGIAIYFGTNRPGYEGIVQKELVLRLNPSDVNEASVVAVRVELPDGVEFYSGDLPEMAGQRTLTLPFKQGLPIVIHSKEAGVKRVKVEYLDESLREVRSNRIPIRFRQPVGEEKRL